MRLRSIRVIFLAGVMLIGACLCPLPARCAENATSFAAPAIDETPVFQAVRDSVTALQTALHRKVASVLTSKAADKIEGAAYESTWQVTVKYWLNHSRPEDVPYLKGMLKCLAECGPTASKEWVAWAETQIDQKRSVYADEIAFQQELSLRIAVTASLDESGHLIVPGIKVFHVVSESEMVTVSAEMLAAPSDSQMQQYGYYFLKDRLSPASTTQPSSGTAAAPESPKTPSTSKGSASSTSPVAIASRSGDAGNTGSARGILKIGIGGLVALILLLILNQYLLRRR